MFPFQDRKRSFCPDFAQAHHAPVSLTANTLVTSIKSRITTAAKNSASDSCLFETVRISFTVSARISLHLITSQIFPGCLTAIQALINEPDTFRTTKCILLWQVVKAVFFWRVGELNSWDISGNTQQLQTTMNGTGIVTTIQRNALHWDPILNLPLQMAQNQQAFFLIGSTHRCRLQFHVCSLL